jgi:hypothetical protein
MAVSWFERASEQSGPLPQLRGRDLHSIPALEVLDADPEEIRRYAYSLNLRGRHDHRNLTSLPWLSAQVLGVRLLDDARDTGRIRRMLRHPSPVVRAACLMSRRLPRAARRALIGLSPTDERQYGRAVAWDLYYMVRNPELHAEELRAIIDLTYTVDGAFWDSLPNQGFHVVSSTAERLRLQEEIIFRALEHPSCPVDLHGWALDYYISIHQPARLDDPRLMTLVGRLVETPPGRQRLGRAVDRLLSSDAEQASRWVRNVQEDLLRRGQLTRIEFDHLFRFGDIDMIADSLRAGVSEQAYEVGRALLVQRVAEERPQRLADVWNLEGSMVAAVLATLDLPEAKIKAASRLDLPDQFRQHLERWALDHADQEASHRILHNSRAAAMHDTDTTRATRQVVEWGKRQLDPSRKALWDELMGEADAKPATGKTRSPNSELGKPNPPFQP